MATRSISHGDDRLPLRIRQRRPGCQGCAQRFDGACHQTLLAREDRGGLRQRQGEHSRVQAVPPVNWRTLVGGGAAVLLSLPLALLLWGMLRPKVPSQAPAEVRLSPMLAPEQRGQLMTYRRECNSGSECEPPLGCLFEARYNQAYCTDSQCMTDEQCLEDQVCRPLATKENGLRVRICVPVGVRQEGETCDPAPKDKEHACSSGLVCGGQNDSWCGRPCHPGAHSTECPDGFFCADTVPEPLCLPTCEPQGCPQNQQCVRFEEGASVCAHIHGPNCQQSPCPNDRKCSVLTSPSQPGKAWMECLERCGKGLPPCSTGKVCDVWVCLPSCDPKGPNVCDEGYRCREGWPDTPLACRPDW